MSTVFIVVFIVLFGLALIKIMKKKMKSDPPIKYPQTPSQDNPCKTYRIAVGDTNKKSVIIYLDCNNTQKTIDTVEGAEFCANSVEYYDKSNIFLIDYGSCIPQQH